MAILMCLGGTPKQAYEMTLVQIVLLGTFSALIAVSSRIFRCRFSRCCLRISCRAVSSTKWKFRRSCFALFMGTSRQHYLLPADSVEDL